MHKMFGNEIMLSIPQFQSGLAVVHVQFFVRFRYIDTVAFAYFGGYEGMVDDGDAKSESEGFLVFRLIQSKLWVVLFCTV